MSWLRAAALTALAAATTSPALADDDAPIHRLVNEVNARLDAAIAARPPKLVPPKKVAIKWRLAKLGTVDLGAPLVALTGADLDGDGHGELYAVTPREVIALGLRGKKLDEVGRVAFLGDHAMPMPRDVIGTATYDGVGVVVGVSAWTKSIRVKWQGKGLAAELMDPGFLVCRGEVATLAPGRNYFGDAQTGMYGARCRTLVDPSGAPVSVRAQLSMSTRLDVTMGAEKFDYPNVGYAFEVADVERDGKPEVIYAAAGAPGDPDILRVITLGDDDKRHPRLKRQFAAGGVAGLAVVDLDGDGVDEVIAAVRLVGSTRVDLWRLE